jgi:tetratricopeptide (TPR) repeat protein
MNKKRLLLFFMFSAIIILIAGVELKLRVNGRQQRLDAQRIYYDADFKIMYTDIYKKFFKKESSEGNYLPCRLYSNAVKFPIFKNPATIRIFIIGGSVAFSYSDTYFLEAISKAIPDRTVEVINCGMGGYDSYRVFLVLKEILHYRPDLVIVFSGNNESNYNKSGFNLWAYNLAKFFRRSSIYSSLEQKILFILYKERMHPQRDVSTRMRDYERYLRFIIKISKARRIPLILCTLPVNFRDCAPAEGTPPYYDKNFLLAKLDLEEERYDSAIKGFKNFLEQYPDDKFALYYLGRAYDEGRRIS